VRQSVLKVRLSPLCKHLKSSRNRLSQLSKSRIVLFVVLITNAIPATSAASGSQRLAKDSPDRVAAAFCGPCTIPGLLRLQLT